MSEIEAEVLRVGAQGDGLAAGGLFVPYGLPGELIAGQREKDRLIKPRVLKASPERVEPECRHFGICGGCLLQHWETSAYRSWKRGLVVEALSREGVETQVHQLVDAHGEGRRRAIFHARQIGPRTIVGFAERKSHSMVPIVECPILAPALDQALPVAKAVAEALAGQKKPLDLHVTATESGLDLDFRGSGPLPPMLLMDLAEIAERFDLARLTRHGEMVVQRRLPFLPMGLARVELPPASFLQATAAGEAMLAGAVEEGVRGAKSVADLFCGVGTFALRLASHARVRGYEFSESAITAMLKAVRGTPGLKGAEGEVRDLFRRPLMPDELQRFEAVVIDPPRQGAEAQAHELARSKVERLAYVSCSAATFARDARILMAGGFRLAGVTPYDQFRYSPHVELVGLFHR
ncbi:putative RNA methyltransferase [Azorhizobium oxalatiphilum]|uniref:RNA methyltransferase n=1 Tax=Azorhizobium oxalatiphilum TaxID=980631 RepID=A0A917BRE2_9HYPH|nr:class I SAM-dependent RNA methyltransferase [Azorhizobium oxalatiphilum]GGF53931.1 putative RNA methyltransferase [Azorhizobium oxalatiphilum]